MTIEYSHGDILTSHRTVLVNPVNCVGVMGAGLAAAFKAKYPAMNEIYVRECARGKMRPGKVLLVHSGVPDRYVACFPTKDHFNNYSELAWIRDGLADLVKQLEVHVLHSVAIPALGCGLGGLKWVDVAPLIEAAFKPVPHIEVTVFQPDPVTRRRP